MKISVLGSTGTMGGLIIKAALRDGLNVVGRISSKDKISDLFYNTDVIVDFSCPLATHSTLEYALQHEQSIPMIIGTTGLSDKCIELMKIASRLFPIFSSPNMNLLTSVMNMIVYVMGRLLDESFDVEITETHHRLKKDAPSGTALMLGRSVAKARGKKLQDVAVFDRHGIVPQRQIGEIGFAIRRCGKIVGEHEVSFTGDFEEIDIIHKSFSKEIFANGAIKAVRWIVAQPPGLYTMNNFTKDLIVPLVKDLYKDFFSWKRTQY